MEALDDMHKTNKTNDLNMLVLKSLTSSNLSQGGEHFTITARHAQMSGVLAALLEETGGEEAFNSTEPISVPAPQCGLRTMVEWMRRCTFETVEAVPSRSVMAGKIVEEVMLQEMSPGGAGAFANLAVTATVMDVPELQQACVDQIVQTINCVQACGSSSGSSHESSEHFLHTLLGVSADDALSADEKKDVRQNFAWALKYLDRTAPKVVS
jgi:hypothetical protein